ncbi:MAG: hypothetical protein AAGB26_12570 [Planctomycetota bacterium]
MKPMFCFLLSLDILTGCQTALPVESPPEPTSELTETLDPMGIIGVYAVDDEDIKAVQQDNSEAELALSTTLSISTTDITLAGLIDFVRAGAGVNVVPNWQALELVGIDQETKITLHTREVPARMLLDLALEQASADAFDDDRATLSLDGGVVRISTIRELSSRTITRVYDIGWFTKPNNALAQQLYREHPDVAKLLRFAWKPENPLSRAIEDGGLYCALCNAVTKPDGTVDCHSFQTRIDQLRELIQATVGDPDEWLDEESTIVDLDKQFIIKTTKTNHDSILKLMRTMRQAEVESFKALAREVEATLLLKQAEAHRLKQEDKQALRLIDRALRVDPGHPEAGVLRQIVIDAMGR